MNEVSKRELIEKLASISIEEVSKYLSKCGQIPSSLRNVGVETLFDLYCTNLESLQVPNGFAMKRSLDLQKRFKELPIEIYQDIIFWNEENIIIPREYNDDMSLQDVLSSILDDLYKYIKECENRAGQIRLNIDRKRISNLVFAINACYYENRDLVYISKGLGFEDVERVRQLLKVELLGPLFNGERITRGEEVLGRVSINKKALKRIKDYSDSILFSCTNTPPKIFEQHALNIDSILIFDDIGFIIVPKGEKLCYETVLHATIDELTKSLKPIAIEELLERINVNKKIQRDVYGQDKEYSNDFIYSLLYSEGLAFVDEKGVLIHYKYIKNDIGSIIEERALARIIADNDTPITKAEVIAEYNNRYGLLERCNLSTTKKFGCKAYAGGRTHWVYGGIEKSKPSEWIEAYARKIENFYFDELYEAIVEAGYVCSKNTIRTYITNCCFVDNNDRNHFCYKSCVHKYKNNNWRDTPRYGIINWVAANIHALFENRKVEELSIQEINEFLFNVGSCSDYKVDNVYDYARYIPNVPIASYSETDNTPFIVKSGERGNWALMKNREVYDSIDWRNFGMKGRSNEQKLLALAVNIVRQTRYLRINLIDLTDKIYESDNIDNLDRYQIRKKLLSYITESNIPHPLKLHTSNSGRRLIEVSVDARKIVNVAQYRPINADVKIQYKTISQIARLDWDALCNVMRRELEFYSKWLLLDSTITITYEDAFNKLVNFIKGSKNKNLNLIVPQRLYEFFFVSDPTDDDRYCIMCSIAKNFEALLTAIYEANTGKKIFAKTGLFDLTKEAGFEEFNAVLDKNVRISDFRDGTYEKSLKYLLRVRNADSHGNWYVDTYTGDNKSEAERNIEKIRSFAGLYIYAIAKYLV